jgi:hypothetical protein
MVQEIELSIPQSYGDITLKKWLDLQEQMQSYKDDEEAVNAIMLYHLCGLDANWINGLDIDSFNKIMAELNKFLSNTDLPLQRFVKIDGVEYGFEPNLSEMAYGAYVDISKFETFSIDKNWAKIMNILYRPVIKKNGDMYQIKPYTIGEDESKWLSVGMDIHFGALFFFVHLSIDLFSSTLKSLKEEELPPNIKLILEKSGELIPRFMNSPKETLPNSVKS